MLIIRVLQVDNLHNINYMPHILPSNRAHLLYQWQRMCGGGNGR